MANIYDIRTREPRSKLHEPTLAAPGINREKMLQQLDELDFDAQILSTAADSAALNQADHNLIGVLYKVHSRMERATAALRILI